MWLFSSSVGRKFIMSITGAALVLFLTFHCLMNSVAILWPAAYNEVCAFLGANWYALIASMGLALLFIIHIIYALVLTVQNRRARGNNRYLVSKRPASVEWSSQNMLVLGIVIVLFLGLHLVQFWSKMQLAELQGFSNWYTEEGVAVPPAAGTIFLQLAFQNVWVGIVYIIAFVALWFHLTHGFWSMFQSIGWDNTRWIPRLKCIGNWWVSIVVGLFVVQVLLFTAQASKNYYIDNQKLEEQYVESYLNEVKEEAAGINMMNEPEKLQQLQQDFEAFSKKFAPTMVKQQEEAQAQQQAMQEAQMQQYMQQMQAEQGNAEADEAEVPATEDTTK